MDNAPEKSQFEKCLNCDYNFPATNTACPFCGISRQAAQARIQESAAREEETRQAQEAQNQAASKEVTEPPEAQPSLTPETTPVPPGPLQNALLQSAETQST